MSTSASGFLGVRGLERDEGELANPTSAACAEDQRAVRELGIDERLARRGGVLVRIAGKVAVSGGACIAVACRARL
jgi:hypothetical protein